MRPILHLKQFHVDNDYYGLFGGGKKPPGPGHNNPKNPTGPIPVPPIIPPPGRAPPDDAQKAIDDYRAQHNMPAGEGTVAHANVDGKARLWREFSRFGIHE